MIRQQHVQAPVVTSVTATSKLPLLVDPSSVQPSPSAASSSQHSQQPSHSAISLPPINNNAPIDIQAITTALQSLSLPSSTSNSNAVSPPLSTDAQWLVSLLDQTYDALQLALALSPQIFNTIDVAALSNVETANALREHFHIEEIYHNLIDKQSAEQKEDMTEVEDNTNGVAERQNMEILVSDSMRSVTRLILLHPPLFQSILLQSSTDEESIAADFIQLFDRLRGNMAYHLRQTAEQAEAQTANLTQLTSLEQTDTLKFCELTEQLTVARAQHTSTLENLDTQIQRLTQQKQVMTDKFVLQRDAFMETTLRERTEADEQFIALETSLLADCEAAIKQLTDEQSENWKKEIAAHRRRQLRETDLDEQIALYDRDLQYQYDALQQLTAIYERETKESTLLTAFINRKTAEEKTLNDEKARIIAERTAENIEARKNEEASVLVHSLFALWMKKNGPKEKKVKAVKKKLMWRPPKETVANPSDGAVTSRPTARAAATGSA